MIELLLAISIFAITAVCIYGTFAAGLRLSRQAEDRGEVYREMRWVADLMAKELENMVPYDFSNSYPDKAAFEGDHQEITFILGTSEGLNVVRYSLVSPEEASVHTVEIGRTYTKNVDVTLTNRTETRLSYLIRKEQDLRDYLSGAQGGATEVIASRVRADSLRFFYSYLEDEKTKTYAWKDSWPLKYIPSSVRVQMDFVLPGKGEALVPVTRDVLIPAGFWGMEDVPLDSDFEG